MKMHILVTVVAVGALAGLPGCRDKGTVGQGDTPKPQVLSPEVGQQLEGIVRSEAVKGAVPQGWTLESVQVQARSIVVKLTGPGGGTASFEMRSPDGGGTEKGRWFSYDVPATPMGLKALAAALDAGFHASPWSEPKHEGVAPHPGEVPIAPAPGPGSQPPAPPVAPPAPADPPAVPPSPTPAGPGGPPPAATPAPAPAPTPATPSPPPAPQSRIPPDPTPAWTVLASASVQVLLVIGSVGYVLRDAWRS